MQDHPPPDSPEIPKSVEQKFSENLRLFVKGTIEHDKIIKVEEAAEFIESLTQFNLNTVLIDFHLKSIGLIDDEISTLEEISKRGKVSLNQLGGIETKKHERKLQEVQVSACRSLSVDLQKRLADEIEKLSHGSPELEDYLWHVAEATGKYSKEIS